MIKYLRVFVMAAFWRKIHFWAGIIDWRLRSLWYDWVSRSLLYVSNLCQVLVVRGPSLRSGWRCGRFKWVSGPSHTIPGSTPVYLIFIRAFPALKKNVSNLWQKGTWRYGIGAVSPRNFCFLDIFFSIFVVYVAWTKWIKYFYSSD